MKSRNLVESNSEMSSISCQDLVAATKQLSQLSIKRGEIKRAKIDEEKRSKSLFWKLEINDSN